MTLDHLSAGKWADQAESALPVFAPPSGGIVERAGRSSLPFFHPMTDIEALTRVIGILDPCAKTHLGLRRGGRLLLALPQQRKAFSKTLGLYQPQRTAARMMVAALDKLSRIGCHGALLARIDVNPVEMALSPCLPAIDPGTCGVLLGSPEHRVRRAIASYQKDGIWEVAKISFGEEGARVLEQEARILKELESTVEGVPQLLGLHRGNGATVMRMPYLTGRPTPPGEYAAALELLDTWVTGLSPKPITGFPEWVAIQSALSAIRNGDQLLDRLSRENVRPAICHGDFARWNLLRQADGKLVVLDWEWGHADGMPGIDLVHYILQDARLVERLAPADAIKKTCELMNSPDCAKYLQKTGWRGDTLLPVIASLAWKQGARHQENSEILEEALSLAGKRGFDKTAYE